MILIPTEQEAENIRCDIIGAARRGEDAAIRMLALYFKRVGMKDYITVLRQYVIDHSVWHYQDAEMIPSDRVMFRIINENLR